jgi:hypothetical protein
MYGFTPPRRPPIRETRPTRVTNAHATPQMAIVGSHFSIQKAPVFNFQFSWSCEAQHVLICGAALIRPDQCSQDESLQLGPAEAGFSMRLFVAFGA